MPDITHLQFALLFLTSLLFAGAFILGLRNFRHASTVGSILHRGATGPEASMGIPARTAIAIATVLDLALLLWRAASENKLSLPLSNHFDAFTLLALLLAIVLIYLRWTRHLRSLAFFLLPMIVVLLIMGAALSLYAPQNYYYGSIWMDVHIVSIIAGTLCFALGCVGGIVYLIAHRQLKQKGSAGVDGSRRWIGLPPLASIEKFNQWMIYLGFPLLTIAIITGALRVIQEPDILQRTPLLWKISLATLSWLVYAVIAHLPLAPRFRGPRAAWLWIIGFALFIGGFVVASGIRIGGGGS
ncbi:MAG TPA: cytochrome c biogenesis protein CcsA [Phycisphaerae bacterium]|nr:cytochrome c biogenesis protein CcsA [Phycisphaerae bacterium]